MKKMIKKIVIILIFTLLQFVRVFAQGGPTPPNVYLPPEEPDPVAYDPNAIPVDGGIGFVLSAGIAFYSRKKILEQRSKKNTSLE